MKLSQASLNHNRSPMIAGMRSTSISHLSNVHLPRSPCTTRATPRITTAKASNSQTPSVAVPTTPTPDPEPSSLPLIVKIPAGFIALIVVLRTLKAIKRRFSGGSALEERGYIRQGVADDSYYSKLMKNMKTVQYDELSEEEIMAARMRRKREVAKDMAPMDLDQIELPENHPFAVKKEISQEEEELMKARLSARRGLSPEDMIELRKQQALAAQMNEEDEQRRRGRQ